VALTVPPDALVVREKAMPAPLPPEAVKVLAPRGATLVALGVMLSPPPTEMLAVALLPSESVTVTTSVALGVGPAV
jgi:hypothetical protein